MQLPSMLLIDSRSSLWFVDDGDDDDDVLHLHLDDENEAAVVDSIVMVVVELNDGLERPMMM